MSVLVAVIAVYDGGVPAPPGLERLELAARWDAWSAPALLALALCLGIAAGALLSEHLRRTSAP